MLNLLTLSWKGKAMTREGKRMEIIDTNWRLTRKQRNESCNFKGVTIM